MDGLEVLVKEWEDIRDQIKRRVEQRNYMTEVMAVLVAGLITAAITTTVSVASEYSFFVFSIVPFITAFFIFLIKASYIRHRCLTTHIKRIEWEINDELTKKESSRRILFWEPWFKETQETNRITAYNTFNIATLLVCGVIFTITLFASSKLGIFSWIPFSIFWGCGVLILYRSFITADDIHEAIDLTKPPIKLGSDEFLVRQLTYSQFYLEYQEFDVGRLNLTSLFQVRRLKGILIITNKKAFFIPKKQKIFNAYYNKNPKIIRFPLNDLTFMDDISEPAQLRFSDIFPYCNNEKCPRLTCGCCNSLLLSQFFAELVKNNSPVQI